jgi:hypothetical protein
VNWIAKLGQNIQFVAFWAHLGVAALLVEHLPWHRWVAIGITVLGAFKEYYYDARNEQDPPQTFWDNTEDFAGWFLGAVIGYALSF